METRANYVLIGGFTLLASIFLLLFALWAAKFSSDRNWREYQVVFTEAVTGLTEGGSVQYNGISVGTVDKLSLAPDDARKVIALLKLKADAPIKVDTRAKLSQQGITGVPVILLSGGSPGAALLEPNDNGDIPIIRTEPSALQNIADTANRLVERLDVVLSEANVEHISATLENLDRISATLADRDQGMEALLVSARDAARNLDTTLQTTNGTMQRLDQNLVQQLPEVIARLESTLARLDSAAGNAAAILGENRAAIHSFANDGLGQLGPTLVELRGLIGDLRQISDRISGSPPRFLLGRDAPKEYEPE